MLQAERLADMTDLERNFEKSQAILAELEEEREAADAQLAEATAQVESLTAELATAKDEAVMCAQDLEAAEVCFLQLPFACYLHQQKTTSHLCELSHSPCSTASEWFCVHEKRVTLRHGLGVPAESC
jgi:hypothetical protein